MPEKKDELKKKKKRTPRKSKPEEGGIGGSQNRNPHISVGRYGSRIDRSPALSPEKQEQPKVEEVVEPLTYIPTEKDAILDKIDEITSHIFDSASLALMKRIIEDMERTLEPEDEQEFYETISKNISLIYGLMDKIVYHWYHQEDFYAGLTEFLQLMFPGRLYELAMLQYEDLIYEAAYADEQAKLSLFGYGNTYKK